MLRAFRCRSRAWLWRSGQHFFHQLDSLAKLRKVEALSATVSGKLEKFAAIFHASSRGLLWVFRSHVVWNANVRIIEQV